VLGKHDLTAGSLRNGHSLLMWMLKHAVDGCHGDQRDGFPAWWIEALSVEKRVEWDE
jgi:hypothetical protein